ncbi:MAG: cation acetate symporter [Candidatus Accumulibacter sp.]|jgi:cation/acetate symporter|uniref:sodium:solute symporter family protein n=1 Tax=Accumulibacter sp. TaxID=2053492 RepID=UPI001B27BDE4|nr:sodium:solute symporter family protein [Accumulibacter sp.]MBO3713919.1 cation acetate symporter [Accumulibacter sp.]
MSILLWTWIITGASFALYIWIAYASRARTTGDFYVAEKQVPAFMNGMATGADWMSAASFISMAGLISFLGRDGSYYLMGWTGGYVLLAMLFGPYLRKYGKFTIPQFIGDRYYSNTARVIALVCAIFVSFTYVAGQMRGVGVVFSRFMDVPIDYGVIIGMALVFFYATLGGMKGITYTQVAQYVVLIVAYLIPAIFVSWQFTGNPVPQIGFGSPVSAEGAAILNDPNTQGRYLLDILNSIHKDLGFPAYTSGQRPMIDVFFITFSLMIGTAGLPHILIRFFTVPRMRDARSSAGWALIFIALLYTTAPAVAVFARTNFIKTVNNVEYVNAPSWFKNWEKTGLVGWKDKNGDGIMQIRPGKWDDPKSANEVKIDQDIMVLASPEIAKLPNWTVGLIGAGGLAAALSTAAGLLLVISAAISHDLMKGIVKPDMSEKEELWWARGGAGVAVIIAGLFGIYPPGFVAQVVAFAFGLAAASFFPALLMGIFNKRMNKEGAVAGMIVGIIFTATYIWWFKYGDPAANNPAGWWLGISPEGIGTVGAALNFVTAYVISKFTAEPSAEIQDLVGSLRYPGRLEAPATSSH